jgi:hypothetical protein
MTMPMGTIFAWSQPLPGLILLVSEYRHRRRRTIAMQKAHGGVVIMVKTHLAIVAGVLAVTVVTTAWSAELNDDIEEKVQEALKWSWLHPGEGFRALFKAAGAEGLPALKLHRHDSIALQAAWEEVTLTVPEKPLQVIRPNSNKLHWFLGFLEGRVQVQAPPWWTEMVLDCTSRGRRRIYAGQSDKYPYEKVGPDSLWAPRGTTLKMNGDRFMLQIHDQCVLIPKDLMRPGDGNISALITPRHCYLATHSFEGSTFPLVCIDRASSKIVWKSEVWATYGCIGPLNYHLVQVTQQNDRIVVFGAGTTGIYMEGFRADNGENLFRLSSAN